MNGQGTYYFKCGGKYSGNWRESKQDGFGVAEYNNGSRYEGEWL